MDRLVKLAHGARWSHSGAKVFYQRGLSFENAGSSKQFEFTLKNDLMQAGLGAHHCILRDSAGKLWAFGSNFYGQVIMDKLSPDK
jgi:alpha-tubulin suppressor-like RCC1 family protein